jgi:hypothetical protein
MKNPVKERKVSTRGLKDHLPMEGLGREDMTQLYVWSFEDALKAQEEATTKDPNIARGPFHRWLGAQELKDLFELYKSGNKDAIIEAIYVCSLNSLPIPRWCEYAYLAAYRKVRHYKAKSWDDVFGHPHKKRTHLEAKRQEREKSFPVYQRIRQIKRENPSIPIDGLLFEEVGQQFNIGKTLTEEYYYKWKKRIERKQI